MLTEENLKLSEEASKHAIRIPRKYIHLVHTIYIFIGNDRYLLILWLTQKNRYPNSSTWQRRVSTYTCCIALVCTHRILINEMLHCDLIQWLHTNIWPAYYSNSTHQNNHRHYLHVAAWRGSANAFFMTSPECTTWNSLGTYRWVKTCCACFTDPLGRCDPDLPVQIRHIFEPLSPMSTNIFEDFEPLGLLFQFVFAFFDTFVQVMQTIVAVVWLVHHIDLKRMCQGQTKMKSGRWSWIVLALCSSTRYLMISKLPEYTACINGEIPYGSWHRRWRQDSKNVGMQLQACVR